MKKINFAEMFSFPAGSIAAVVVGCVVLVLVAIKVLCVVTGHDKKLPEVCFADEEEDREKMLFEANSFGIFKSSNCFFLIITHKTQKSESTPRFP